MVKKNYLIEKLAIFITGCAMLSILILAFGALIVILYNGLGIYWQKNIHLYNLKNGSKLLGSEFNKGTDLDKNNTILIKLYNKEINNPEYVWVKEDDITSVDSLKSVVLIERLSGEFIGFLNDKQQIDINAQEQAESNWHKASAEMKKENELNSQADSINKQIYQIEENQIKSDYQKIDPTNPEYQNLLAQKNELESKLTNINQDLVAAKAKSDANILTAYDINNGPHEIMFKEIINIIYPNQMWFLSKLTNYIKHLWILVSADPREANTEGGIFPAIFGTICLILLMSIVSFPLGVITAIYLREYSKDGWFLKSVRIAISNLASVPSIVYGIFGLGFFIYGIGGLIDRVFYPQNLPNPTFGTGNILWASMTLGLLTAPVVIIATEEALNAIPRGIREASLALGATKWQTVLRVVVPLSAPGMITGFILAMARAAGEVAPLMITGVVKLAPSLPIDGQFPYVHLTRKFMHIGFHIFDVGFQSPNVESAKSIVYISTLLLLTIVIILSSGAIYIRNKMIAKHLIY